MEESRGAPLPTCCLAAPSAARPRRGPRGSSGSPSLPLPPPLARLPPQPGRAPEAPSPSRGRSVAMAGTPLSAAAAAPGRRWKRAGRRGVRGTDRRHVAGRSSAARWRPPARRWPAARHCALDISEIQVIRAKELVLFPSDQARIHKWRLREQRASHCKRRAGLKPPGETKHIQVYGT